MQRMRIRWHGIFLRCKRRVFLFLFNYIQNISFRKIGWLGGCGALVCTGMRNWFLSDIDGEFMGNGYPIQFISNNPDMFTRDTLGCTQNKKINGYICPGE